MSSVDEFGGGHEKEISPAREIDLAQTGEQKNQYFFVRPTDEVIAGKKYNPRHVELTE